MESVSKFLSNRRTALALAAGLLLGIAAFIPGIVAWFTSEELTLIYLVRDNPFKVWSGTDGQAGFFRPVVTMIIWATYNLFGLEPRPYHLVNVMLHLANSMLLYAVARGWSAILPDGHRLRNRVFPAVAALWFWVWPSHSEPVCWIPALTDVAAATFGMASIAVYIRGRNAGSLLWGGAALLLYAVALSAKESVIAMPGVIFLYEVSRWWVLRGSMGRALIGPAAYGFMMLAYFQMRYLTMGAYIGGYGTAMHTDFSWERLQWTVSPNLMNVFLPLPLDDVAVKNWIVIALAVFGSLAVLWRYRKSSDSPVIILLAAAAAVVAFVPAFNLGPHFITEGQRFSYLPSAFGVLAMAALLVYLLPQGRVINTTAWVVAIAAAGLLASYNANWYYAGKVARKAVRGMKKLPEARRLYVLATTKAYREAFILPHSLDITSKLMLEKPPVQEFVLAGAVTYWDPSVKLIAAPVPEETATFTLTLTHDRHSKKLPPRLEAFGTGAFVKPLFEATGGGDSIRVVLHDFDPAQDKIGYLEGGNWVILP